MFELIRNGHLNNTAHNVCSPKLCHIGKCFMQQQDEKTDEC